MSRILQWKNDDCLASGKLLPPARSSAVGNPQDAAANPVIKHCSQIVFVPIREYGKPFAWIGVGRVGR